MWPGVNSDLGNPSRPDQLISRSQPTAEHLPIVELVLAKQIKEEEEEEEEEEETKPFRLRMVKKKAQVVHR